VSTVLVIDDDAGLLDVLSLSLEEAGHSVLTAPDGVKGLACVRERAPDLVLTDVNLPRLDGFTLCRTLRAEGNAVPLIVLTSRDDEIDESLGFALGADDYVSKPFSTRVLLARIAALLRRDALRARGAPEDRPAITGELEILAERLEARYRGQLLTLTVSEFRLLEGLVRRPGVVRSRAQLLEDVRGNDSVVDDRLIDTYVRRLRRAFGEVDRAFARIETVIGVGYRWVDRAG
jgi:DNA-binding response OmpR family regulator